MPKAATAASVNAAESGPDYKGAIKVIRGPIAASKKESSALGQDIGEEWKRIEKNLGLNRAGAQIFAKLDNMAPETRSDALRTLLGLLGVAGYDDFDDLVDRAQTGPASPPPPAPSAPTPAAPAPASPAAIVEPPADDSDLVAAADPAPETTAQVEAPAAPEPQSGKGRAKLSIVEAIDQSKKHLGAGAAK